MQPNDGNYKRNGRKKINNYTWLEKKKERNCTTILTYILTEEKPWWHNNCKVYIWTTLKKMKN